MRALAIAATLLATPALAQGAKVWTPAPTPGTTESRGAPADRAGVATSADVDAPFSATPNGAISGSGRTSPATVGTTPRTDTVTPNLSK